MKYYIKINKKIRNVRVYAILKKVGGNQNFLTDIFLKIFNRPKSSEANR